MRQFAAKLTGEVRDDRLQRGARRRSRPLDERDRRASRDLAHGTAAGVHLVGGWAEGAPRPTFSSEATQRGLVRPSSPACPPCLATSQPDQPVPTAGSTGRRLWLARWLTSPENPLVARVIVNRIWQFHFGEGLVATSSDFGVMGDPPSHPELLDWLASELVASGWRLKPLHRLIVLSQTYQRSSANRAEAATG